MNMHEYEGTPHPRGRERAGLFSLLRFAVRLASSAGDLVVLRLEIDEPRIGIAWTKAQKLVRKHVTPAVSLVDDLTAERREDAERESDPL